MAGADDSAGNRSQEPAGHLATPVATRTLIAAGFVIERARRFSHHIEYSCRRLGVFGMPVQYLVALFDQDDPPPVDIDELRRSAERDAKILVVVTPSGGGDYLSSQEFALALGGLVSSWRSLAPEYPDHVRNLAGNRTPADLQGEAWQLFELAVADGLEFILGRRVRRLGGRMRGRRVSDILAPTPDDRLLVVDAKASASPYDVSWDNLRPLREYVYGQRLRQQGQSQVASGLIVASSFAQFDDRLLELAADFQAETGLPLAFLDVELFLRMIEVVRTNIPTRSAIRWARVFSVSGRMRGSVFDRELASARDQRVPRDAIEPAGED